MDPGGWRGRLGGFARVALNAADAALRFPLAPPDAVDRDIRRLRRIVASEPSTVILCDNEGQLERLEELLETAGATLVVGALDGGFLVPRLRPLAHHQIFLRPRRLRPPPPHPHA